MWVSGWGLRGVPVSGIKTNIFASFSLLIRVNTYKPYLYWKLVIPDEISVSVARFYAVDN